MLSLIVGLFRGLPICPGPPSLRAEPPPGLRALLASQGVLSPAAAASWPTRVSFQLLLASLPGASLPYSERYAVNIGAKDGKLHDPVYPLFQSGYRGLALEADRETNHHVLPRNLGAVNTSGGIHIHWGFAKPNNIGDLLRTKGIPREFDALKIDIDSFDLPVLRAVLEADFAPHAVMVEFNPELPPPLQWSLEQHDSFRFGKKRAGKFGASVAALFDLLSGSGGSYSLVAVEMGDSCDGAKLCLRNCGAVEILDAAKVVQRSCVRCESNLWFVRSELLGLPRGETLTGWAHLNFMYWSQYAGMMRFLHRTHNAPRIRSRDDTEWRALALSLTERVSNVSKVAGPGRQDRPLTEKLWNWCQFNSPCPLHLLAHMPLSMATGLSAACHIPAAAAASAQDEQGSLQQLASILAFASENAARHAAGLCDAARGIASNLARACAKGSRCPAQVGIAPNTRC